MIENLRQLNRKIVGAFLVVLVFSTGVFFWDLGVSAIANADEGVHALVTREIRERPDWLTMHIRGETYFRKPPLAFWIRAVSQTVLGENEFATRLPSALAGVATTMLLALWAWQWTRRWQTVAAVGVIFPLLPSTFVHTFRTGETDGTLILLLTLTAYILWHSLRRPKLIILAGLTTGLALMTKSVAAGVVPIGFLLTLAVYRRWPYSWKQVLLATAAFVIVTAPWHVIEHVRHGSAFWNEYLGEHVVERVEERLHVTPKTHGPWWYLTAVERGMYPWAWLVVPAAMVEVLRRRKEPADETGTFLIMWGFGTIVLFSLAATKLAWYVAPAFPALALLVAGFISRPWRRMRTAIMIATAVAVGGYAYITQNDFQAGWSGWLSLSFVPALIVPGGVAIAVLAALALDRRWSKMVTALVLLHMLVFSVVVFSRNMRNRYESPFRVMRNEIVSRDPAAPVYVYPIGYVTSPLSAVYLAGPNHARKVTPLRENQEQLRQIVASEAGVFVIVDHEHPMPEDLKAQVELIRVEGDLELFTVLKK